MPICDSVLVYNNVKTPARLVAKKKNTIEDIEVVEKEMWNQLFEKI